MIARAQTVLHASAAASTAPSVVDGLNWFRPEPGEEEGAGQLEMDLWLQEFLPHVTRNCGKAQQLLQVNLLWRQPVLLKVPKNYDDIFQVSDVKIACCAVPDLLDAGDDMSQFGNLNTNWVIVIQGTKVPYS